MMETKTVFDTPAVRQPWPVEFKEYLQKTALWSGLVNQAGGDPSSLETILLEMYANMCQQADPKKLFECSKTSQVDALRSIISLGVSPSPVHGYIYLIPYGQKLTLQTGYRADVAILRRSDKVEIITVQKVCENDKFDVTDFESTPSGWLKGHTPSFTKSRGPAYGYYAVIKLKDCPATIEYMPKEDVDAWRDKYARKGGEFWGKHYDQMAYKTVLKQALRYYEGIVPNEIKEIMVNSSIEEPYVVPKTMEQAQALPNPQEQQQPAMAGATAPLDQFAAAHAPVPVTQDSEPDEFSNTLFGVPVS